jgi:hypothetical protein
MARRLLSPGLYLLVPCYIPEYRTLHALLCPKNIEFFKPCYIPKIYNSSCPVVSQKYRTLYALLYSR